MKSETKNFSLEEMEVICIIYIQTKLEYNLEINVTLLRVNLILQIESNKTLKIIRDFNHWYYEKLK